MRAIIQGGHKSAYTFVQHLKSNNGEELNTIVPVYFLEEKDYLFSKD